MTDPSGGAGRGRTLAVIGVVIALIVGGLWASAAIDRLAVDPPPDTDTDTDTGHRLIATAIHCDAAYDLERLYRRAERGSDAGVVAMMLGTRCSVLTRTRSVYLGSDWPDGLPFVQVRFPGDREWRWVERRKVTQSNY